MKIIFIDYDGVFVTMASMRAYKEKKISSMIDPMTVMYLNTIIDHTTNVTSKNTECVVISTWRHKGTEREAYSKCFDSLVEAGFIGKFHDDWRTKSLENRVNGITRGHEVDEWLSRHPEVTDYVILDDEGDVSYTEDHWLVQTSSYNGLTYEEAILAATILDKTNYKLMNSYTVKRFVKRQMRNRIQISKLKRWRHRCSKRHGRVGCILSKTKHWRYLCSRTKNCTICLKRTT